MCGLMPGYVTVGTSAYRRCVPYMPDMSWLGEPPTKAIADRYEVARVIRHRAAIAQDLVKREKLEAKALEISRTWTENPKQKARVAEKLNAINAKIAGLGSCKCDICNGNDHGE